MSRKFSDFIIKHRYFILTLIIIITLSSFFGIRKIKFSNKMTSWLSNKDPRLSLFIKASEDFAINNLVLVMVKPKNGKVFEKSFLEKIKRFTEILKGREEIYIVSSLSNTSDIRKTADGIEVRDLLENIPESSDELTKLKNYILSKENYRGNIISKDGRWVAFSVFIKDKFDPVKVTGNFVIPQAEKIFGENSEIFYSGIPSDSFFANKFTIKDLKTLTPIIVLLIILVLFLSFKNWQGVVLPSLVVIISVIWLFGLLGFLNKSLTIISPAIPVLLVALGSAYGIHIINKYFHSSELEDKGKLSLATSEIFIPVALAGLTTLVGFMSFISAKLKLIADFGVFSGIGILFALLISLILIPAAYSFGKKKIVVGKEKREWGLLKRVSLFVIKRKYFVFSFSLFLMIIFIFGILMVKREVNFSEYYPENSQPRLGQNLVKREFQGAYPVLFYINSENVKTPEALRLMRKAEYFLFSKRELAIPFSMIDIIQELNSKLNYEYAIPDKKSSIGNLWFFMEGREEIKQLLSENNKKAIIFSKTAESSTNFNKTLFYDIKRFDKSHLKKRFFSYEFKKLNAKEKRILREKEAEYLSEEIFYVAKHFIPAISKKEKGKIFSLLKISLKEKYKLSAKEKLSIAEKYIKSDEFDFDVDEKTKTLLLKSLYFLFESNSENENKIVSLFEKIIPNDEFDLETAQSSAETILFKINEHTIKERVKRAFEIIKSEFKIKDESFSKRVKSVLFDLFDNLAVLNVENIDGIKGKPIIFEIRQTGNPSLITALDESLFSSQIQSLILAYLITLILMIFMRRSISLGIISTLSILFTVSLMYGFLGFLKIPLDYATMMIGAISIGVGIDYSIHFIHGVLSEIESGKSLQEAVKESFVEKGKAILTNTFAVMLGFAVLLFSSMLPLRNFGGTMVAAMFLSAFSTLTLLPSAILIFKLKIKIKEEK